MVIYSVYLMASCLGDPGLVEPVFLPGGEETADSLCAVKPVLVSSFALNLGETAVDPLAGLFADFLEGLLPDFLVDVALEVEVVRVVESNSSLVLKAHSKLKSNFYN